MTGNITAATEVYNATGVVPVPLAVVPGFVWNAADYTMPEQCGRPGETSTVGIRPTSRPWAALTTYKTAGPTYSMSVVHISQTTSCWSSMDPHGQKDAQRIELGASPNCARGNNREQRHPFRTICQLDRRCRPSSRRDGGFVRGQQSDHHLRGPLRVRRHLLEPVGGTLSTASGSYRWRLRI